MVKKYTTQPERYGQLPVERPSLESIFSEQRPSLASIFDVEPTPEGVPMRGEMAGKTTLERNLTEGKQELLNPTYSIPEAIGRASGEFGSGLFQTGIVEPVVEGFKAFTPEHVKEVAGDVGSYIAQSPAGQWAGEKIGQGVEYAQELAQEYPRTAYNLESALGIAEGMPFAPATVGTAKATARYLPKRAKFNEPLPIFKEAAEGTQEAVGTVKDTVKNLAVARKEEFDGLYKLAEEAGRDAYLTIKPSWELSNSLRREAKDIVDDEGRKILLNTAARVEEIAKGGKANVNELAALRKGLQGGKYAEGKAKSLIDKALDKAIDEGNMLGNPQAGVLWKQATQKARDYYRTFDDANVNPTIKGIVTGKIETTEDLASKLFGAGNVGSARKAGQRYDEVVRVLGNEFEPELKKAIVAKMFKFKTKPSGVAGKDGVWLQGIADEVNRLRVQNKTLWDKFTPDEQDALTLMANSASRAAEGGVLNKAIDKVLGLASGAFRYGGLRTDLRLPSTLQPQQIVDPKDLVGMSRKNIAPSGFRNLKQDLQRAKEGYKASPLGSQKGAIKVGDDDLDDVVKFLEEELKKPKPKPEPVKLPDPVKIADDLKKANPRRMFQAKKQGFDTDRVMYRGLVEPYSEEKASKLGWQMFTTDAEQAGEYGSRGYGMTGQNTVPAFLRKGKELKINGGGRNWNRVPVENLPKDIADRFKGYEAVGTDLIAEAAQKAGYDSVSISNIFDNITNDPFGRPADISIIFDPKNVRSAYAGFNPKDAGKVGLTLGGSGIMLGDDNK